MVWHQSVARSGGPASAWDLPQASPRCPFWLRWACPRPVPAAGLSSLGFPSGVARAASFVCRERMPSKPDVVYRSRARWMALVPKAGMDSPLTCRVQEMTVFQVRSLASLCCQAGRSSVRRGPASGFTSLSQVCSLALICCQAGRYSVRRGPASGSTSLILGSWGNRVQGLKHT